MQDKDRNKKKKQELPVTRQDSLDVYNNSIKVLQYYNNPRYGEKATRSTYPNEQVHELNNSNYQQKKKINFFVSGYSSTKGIQSGKIPEQVYKKKVDDNRYYQREGADGILDTRSPMQLFDKRIKPNFVFTGENKTKGDIMEGDAVAVYSYDPISVKPFDLLNDKEKILRIKKYGRDGVPDSYGKKQELSTLVNKQESSKKNTYQDSLDLYKSSLKDIISSKKGDIDYNIKNNVYFKDNYGKDKIKPIGLDSDGNPIYKKPNKSIVYSKDTPQVQKIDNQLKPTTIQSNKIETTLPIINNSIKVPKYYNIEDTRNGNTGGTTNYQYYPENGKLQELAPEPLNKRKITPIYSDGGEIKQEKPKKKYETILNDEDNIKYQEWRTKLPNNLQNEEDYDLKGLWKNNPNIQPTKDLHFPDIYKKPNHITFSTQSIYNGVDSNFGGNWTKDDKFQPSKQQYNDIGENRYNEYSKLSGDKIDFSRFKNNTNSPSPMTYAYGGTININNMKYTTRLPKNKRHIAPSPIISDTSRKFSDGATGGIGAVLPYAGSAISLISALTQGTAEARARRSMYQDIIQDKNKQDIEDNIDYNINGNNGIEYYAYGGNINDQQEIPKTPQEKRAEVQRLAQIKRDEIVKKKDSIIQRNLNATGLTRQQYRDKLASDAKKPDAQLDGLNTTDANKRSDKKGSCSTGATMGGDSLKDVKAYGGDLPLSLTTGKFDTTGGKLIPISNNAELAIGNTHGSKVIDGQYGITLNDGKQDVAEVENQEVITNGQRVFSDRLKFDKNNTYADKMKKIATMSAKIEDKLSKTKDTKSRNGYERTLAGHKMAEDALYNHQEETQEKEGLDVLNKMAYGGNIDDKDWLKSLLSNTNQDGFNRSNNKAEVIPNEIDTTTYLNKAVNTPITIQNTGTSTAKDPNTPKTFNQYLAPSLIDNGVNAILTATTPRLSKPIKNIPQRLKTNYNVNPELAEISRETNAVSQNVLQNTSDSNTARANIASARLNGALAKNNIYSKKENIETSLINQDKQNLQNINNSNVDLSNKYLGDIFNRSNDIQTRVSGNVANLSGDIKDAQGDVMMDKYYRQQLLLDLQNDITGSKARAYKQNAKLMADPEIAKMVNATFASRNLK